MAMAWTSVGSTKAVGASVGSAGCVRAAPADQTIQSVGRSASRRFDRGQGVGITVDSEAATALGNGSDIVGGVSAGVGTGNDVGSAGTGLGTVVGASVGDGIGTSVDSTEGEAVGMLSQC